MTAKTHTTLIIKLAVLSALVAYPFVGSEFYVELVAKILILGIFAMSLDLLVGFTGLVSLGHSAYFGVAAYAVALISPEYDPANLWIVLPAAVLISALVALCVGLLVLRTRGIYFIMVTLAFTQMAFYLFHDTALGGGSDGIYLNFRPEPRIGDWMPFSFDDGHQLYYFILAATVLVYLAIKAVLRSPFGRVLVGIKSNEHRMRSLGYSTFNYKLGAFVLAGAFAGLAGVLYAVLFGFVTPELLSWHESGHVLMMVILGGMGSPVGAMIGASAMVALEEVFSLLTRHWQLLMGLVIVGVVLFLPGGLIALPARLRQLFNKGGAS